MQKGDFVTADFQAEVEGEPVEGLEATDFVFEVGAGRIFAEVEAGSRGHERGRDQDVPGPAARRLPRATWPARRADFTVTVKEIKEKVLPPLTDSGPRRSASSRPCSSCARRSASKMQAGKTYSADQRFRSLAVKAAADNAKLDMPDVVVDEQAEEMLADFTRSLRGPGRRLRTATWRPPASPCEQMIEDMKPHGRQQREDRLGARRRGEG